MTENTLPSQPVAPQPTVVNSLGAPTLVIDGCPNYGFYDGMGNMTLTAVVRTAMNDGTIRIDSVVVAHARFGLDTARMLKETLEKIILIASKPEGEQAH
jgi:hypothetical protein